MRRICHLVVTLAACTSPRRDVPPDTAVAVDADPTQTENVEIKVAVPVGALTALGLGDANTDKTQDVWFFDTDVLALFDRGLILRARKVHNGGDDTRVRARPRDVTQTARGWLALPGAKCEVDRTLDHAASACSLTADAAKDRIDAVAAGAAIDSLYTADQLVFLGSVAVVDFASLRRLGPIPSTVWKL